ncbi:hypothetical protein NEOC65_002203 [Neochlamydia sp. AcF65]|nr:hypothetical protein [Neochlamydia sp. AcF65]MBS4170244.1 hypothetical protein [Neochlamydia sp. AcF95]
MPTNYHVSLGWSQSPIRRFLVEIKPKDGQILLIEKETKGEGY